MKLNTIQVRTIRRACSRRADQGWSLPESMVTACIGLTFLVALIGIFINCNISFAQIGSLINMDRNSRNALDHMTTNIRNAKQLVSFGAAALVFNYDSAGTTNLAYRYDSPAGTVTEEWSHGGAT